MVMTTKVWGLPPMRKDGYGHGSCRPWGYVQLPILMVVFFVKDWCCWRRRRWWSAEYCSVIGCPFRREHGGWFDVGGVYDYRISRMLFTTSTAANNKKDKLVVAIGGKQSMYIAHETNNCSSGDRPMHVSPSARKDIRRASFCK